MRRALQLLGVALVAALLASCSRLGPNIPTEARAEPSAVSSPTSNVPHISAAAKATTAQLGVQIFWHDVNDAWSVENNATRLLDYTVGLGANSVGISFPIFTDGARPTRVYTKDGVTPTSASLQVLIRAAKARGLRVLLRPLLDEANIATSPGAWRGSIEPRNMAAWFDSYLAVVTPFLMAGQAAGADTFVVGTELNSLVGQATQWSKVMQASARMFTGQLSYADNWDVWATGRPLVAGAAPGLDAYPQLHLPDTATVAQITDAWAAWFRKRPADLTNTVVQEVGIAATPGAYKQPAAWGVPGQSDVPQVQVKWFAGACAAVKALHLTGIYFWNLDAWAEPAKGASRDIGSFIGRGDSAIKECYAAGWPGQ